jgi:uncharacterized membrane protein YphA (DoxX/SURF4 family)
MLSIFPSLLSYQEFSPFMIRIVLAITVAYFGYQEIIKYKQGPSRKSSLIYGIAKILVSIFVFIGLYTQLAALVIAVVLFVKLVLKAKKKELLTDGVDYYILLLALAISLILTGAGWWAFDLPL